jgi:hypothetical protein
MKHLHARHPLRPPLLLSFSFFLHFYNLFLFFFFFLFGHLPHSKVGEEAADSSEGAEVLELRYALRPVAQRRYRILRHHPPHLFCPYLAVVFFFLRWGGPLVSNEALEYVKRCV